MTNCSNGARARRARGFSLIEMMIAMSIGLVVTAAIGYIFMASSKNVNYSQGISRVQENSRSSLIILNTLIRQAGYLNAPMTYLDPSAVFVSGVPAVYGGSGSVTSAFSWISSSGLTLQSGSEFLEVAYVGDYSSTASSDGLMTDCLGRKAIAADVHIDVFFVAKKASEPVPSLYCATEAVQLGTATPDTTNFTPASFAQPLVYGVYSLKVKYGIDSDGDQEANYYSDSSGITTSNWSSIKSVQLNLQVQSTDVVDNQTYAACKSGSGTTSGKNAANDTTVNCGYLVRPLLQTIVLRNRLIK